jgi:flagella basal body P-ring formation protein FlgA
MLGAQRVLAQFTLLLALAIAQLATARCWAQAANTASAAPATATATATASTSTSTSTSDSGHWALPSAELQAMISRVSEAAARELAQQSAVPLKPGSHPPGADGLTVLPSQAAANTSLRIEVQLGQLDSRLKLAPCKHVQPYWPSGQRVLSAARIGLRCLDGPKRWHVYLPVAVRLWGTGLVTTSALPAGTVLAAEHLKLAEVDLATHAEPVLTAPGQVVGRRLAQALPAGQPLRRRQLRLQQWVRPGDQVKLLASSADFQITGQGTALAAAVEGQTVRVKTDSGRVLQGVATAERQVTVPL